MTTRLVRYAEDLTSHSGGGTLTGPEVSYTGTVGENEWVLGQCTGSATAGTGFEIVINDVVGASLPDIVCTPKSLSDFYNFPLMYPGSYPLGSGTPNFDSKILGVSNPSGGLNTSVIREGAIATLKISTLDAGNAAAGVNISGSTSSTTYVALDDPDSASIVVNTTGDYIILVAGQVSKNNTADTFLVKVTINGVDYCETAYAANAADTTRYLPYGFVRKITLTPGTYTISVQGKVTATGTMTFLGSVLALRADTFPAVFYTENLANQTVSNVTTTLTDKLTLSATLQAKPHLIFASALVNRNNGMNWAFVDEVPTTRSSGLMASLAANTQLPLWGFSRWDSGAVNSKTWKLQIASSGSGAGSANIKEAAICVIQESDNVNTHLFGGSLFGGNLF